jgi:hypothetical protein
MNDVMEAQGEGEHWCATEALVEGARVGNAGKKEGAASVS